MVWKRVCAVADIDIGQIAEFQVAVGVCVAVVRSANCVMVVPPLCPHRAEPLRNGFCDEKLITCQKHLWQWEVITGSPTGEARLPLKQYEARVEDGNVMAFIEQELVYEYED